MIAHGRANNFDLIRLLPATQVLVVHFCEHLGAPQTLALTLLGLFPGVPIFFFVSGFLVAGSMARAKSLGKFLANRILRVYPGLLACFAFSLAIAAPFVAIPWLSAEFGVWALAQTTVGQFYNPDFMRTFGLGALNGSLWTIPVEVQFYLALPVLWTLGKKFGDKLLWSVAALALVGHGAFLAFLYGEGTLVAKLVQVSLAPWLGLFMAGMLAQRFWPSIRGVFEGRALSWLAAFVAAALVTAFVHPDGLTGNRMTGPLALVLYGFILAAAHTAPELSDRLLGGNDISYGVYLFHGPLLNLWIELAERRAIALSWPAGLAILAAASFALAFASWKLVEQPALAIKKWRRSVQPGRSA